VTARIAGKIDRTVDTSKRGWFLQDSTWTDVTWKFAPVTVLEEEYPVRVRWDFAMPGGLRFTAPRYAPLLEAPSSSWLLSAGVA
jgi:hypothetical protein